MFIVGMISWWYSDGWKQMILRRQESILDLYDKFSLGLLLKTLFAPWRQISAGSVRGSLSVQFRAFFDRLISRIIGGFIRTVTLIIGLLALVVSLILSLVRIVAWPLLPVAPIVLMIFAIVGWVPWQ